MRFLSVDVIKTKENYHFIEWDMIPGGGESTDDWNFRILWSNDPNSGFLEVTDENGDPIEIDGAVGPLSYTHPRKQYDFNIDQYYKIRAIPKSTGDNVDSNVVFIGMFADGAHETMKDVENTLYNYYQGEPCLIIKRKSFGARCPTCWSQERQQKMRTHCDTCKGTGFVTGYYQPIEMQISFDSDPKKGDLQKEWENMQDTRRARMSNYPLVRPKDLIVNTDDYKRYVIVHVETTKLPRLSESKNKLSRQNYILSQLLTLEELNANDNEYFLDVDNIPEIPQVEDGNSGSTTPFFNDHLPVTVDLPLIITNNKQNVGLQYDDSTLEVVDGELKVKNLEKGLVVKSIFDPTLGLPSNPVAGDRYISSASSHGWVIHNSYVWSGTEWSGTAPLLGDQAWVSDEELEYHFNGIIWVTQQLGISNHNDTLNIQGGSTDERYHLTQTEHDDLTDGGTTTLHSHDVSHNNTEHIQGGVTGERYHLDKTEHDTLTDGSNADSLHTHTMISDHNDTTNIQGGSTDERYHLSKNEHDTLTDGSNADLLHDHGAAAISYSRGAFTTVEEALNSLLRMPPQIVSFSGGSSNELGSIVATVTAAWTKSGDAATQATLTDVPGFTASDFNNTTQHIFSGLSITSNKTYTLTCGDAVLNPTDTHSITVAFYNKLYKGSDANTTMNSSRILALAGPNSLASSRLTTFSMDPAGGYAWICFPTRFGHGTIYVNGFLEAYVESTVSFTNSLGYTENYYCYRSPAPMTGTFSFEVK